PAGNRLRLGLHPGQPGATARRPGADTPPPARRLARWPCTPSAPRPATAAPPRSDRCVPPPRRAGPEGTVATVLAPAPPRLPGLAVPAPVPPHPHPAWSTPSPDRLPLPLPRAETPVRSPGSGARRPPPGPPRRPGRGNVG